ncbi:MAG: LPS export ABC transporter permease LptF [Polaromonas sp. 39-63-203]|jgi:lipopolysaccharide export system permease protein|uniref:LPS export ABC transporter permease LptF n=1 Tax=Polaromonas sp. TaxID=1869339 RepID=UPI000BC699E2|nr:LPS export ABC transporter permease LptF [Polaromonas sp.]OYY52674.1 MAG: LPS export ABC transporter permease LptF [Polaromonas sp. 35-63-240]OYY98523.1 MAG: LPS export ABC transporter permease LptF [Polaromonas sp. 28-63-22]OYZ83890.1 MAG: LPS export ABC transporter permease LptF [Polaromonas sp. 24-62-144]OZA98530.1 MAG: LPS export ABC transporter permease LptF [Polaromonas sp. 39-63-203]HQS32752.1 LPS export ABC transporter permease LptF [Polaromonas sp.]
MLFQSSIRKELARSFGATLVVLVTIVMTIVLIRTLGLASSGFISPQDVMLFMAYSALGRLPTILTLSLFIALVSALSRMYRDSEMVVWFTSGQGLTGFLRPMYRFAWPILLVIGLMALFVWPWSNQRTKDMQTRFEQRGDLARVAPGQFMESSSGNRVFFIDREKAAAQTSNDVFISSNDNGKSAVTTARSGRVETRGDTRFLILEGGQRLESESGQNGIKISEFEEYGTQAGDSDPVSEGTPEAKLLSTRDLLKAPTRSNQSELSWRFGLALAAVNIVVLALALSSVNPRGGRSGNLIFVLLAFVVYNNLLNFGQGWISMGLIGFGNLLVLLHGGVFVLAMAWLIKRNSNWVLRPAPRLQREKLAVRDTEPTA